MWLSFATPTVTEGSPLDLVATRAGGKMSAPLSVGLAWTDPGQRIQGAAPESVQFEAGKATAVVSVPTVLTATVEADSSVTAAIKAGSGYVVGTSSSATATVEENAAPVVPEISVSGGGGVTEGGDASFTVTASPAPAAPLAVDFTVGQDGDFGAATGARAVTVPTSGSAAVTVATVDDSTDESDGSVSVTVDAGDGYTVSGAQGSASVAVSDDDDPPVVDCGADALAAEARANHDGLANTAANRKERNDWWRAWIALSGVTGTYNTPLTVAEAKVLESGDSRWTRFREALECLEQPPPVVVVPEISVSGGGGVTEGGDASFTVTASPAPAAPLAVDFTVGQDGDFGAATGARAVTIPTSGSAAVTVATVDDSTDESDGSVSVTVDAGDGYTVSGAQGSASVAVSDDDDPPPVVPEISVSGGGGVTEGGDASFTVTASPAPAAPLAVDFTVGQDGDFGAATGARAVTIPTSGSAAVTVATVDDSTDESDGSVSVTVDAGDGYTVSGAQGSASVAVSDDDDPPPVVPEISVSGGGGVTEGGDASFTVTASPAPAAPLAVDFTVGQDGDFGAATGARAVTIPTSGSAAVTVATVDDSTDESDGSVSVTVDAGDGYTVSGAQGSASVAVSDDDDPPPVVPEISVSGGGGVTEGGDASFTVTASPAPAAPLAVDFTVGQDGDFGAATGARAVTIPTSGSAAVTVATVDDSTDESDGSVSVTVDAGDGYTVSGAQGSASVAVSDDDDPPPPDLPEVSVSDGSVVEGQSGLLSLLEFRVTLSEASKQDVTVGYVVRSGTAIGGLDYWGFRGQVTIWAGSTSATIGVNVRDDNRRERDETLSVELTEVGGAVIAADTAVGTIIDND